MPSRTWKLWANRDLLKDCSGVAEKMKLPTKHPKCWQILNPNIIFFLFYLLSFFYLHVDQQATMLPCLWCHTAPCLVTYPKHVMNIVGPAGTGPWHIWLPGLWIAFRHTSFISHALELDTLLWGENNMNTTKHDILDSIFSCSHMVPY